MAKSKQIVGIDCDGAAAAAIRLVLCTRFEEMCALRDEALKWSNLEGVHDMRVSSRRLRGALRDFMPYLRKRKLAPVLKQLQSLADALGAVRDQDVAIIGLRKLEAGARRQTPPRWSINSSRRRKRSEPKHARSCEWRCTKVARSNYRRRRSSG